MPFLGGMRYALLLVLSAVAASAQTPRPRQSVTLDVIGPYLFGVGVTYEAPVAGPLDVRAGVGVRDVSIFGGGGDPAASVSAVVATGTGWIAAEGGAGVTATRRDGAFDAVPHVLAGLRLRAPVGRTLAEGRPVASDLLFRLGVVVLYDPDLRCCADPPRGPTVWPVPSVGAGLAF